MTIEQIATVCHEANKSLCNTQGDNSQTSWESAPQWQRESAIKGVEFCVNNPNAPASANHDSWMKQKLDEGWVYGPVKDPSKKQHPCIVPYEGLPSEQQSKDYLFKAIVGSLSQYL